jgi:hypothetical protein
MEVTGTSGLGPERLLGVMPSDLHGIQSAVRPTLGKSAYENLKRFQRLGLQLPLD